MRSVVGVLVGKFGMSVLVSIQVVSVEVDGRQSAGVVGGFFGLGVGLLLLERQNAGDDQIGEFVQAGAFLDFVNHGLGDQVYKIVALIGVGVGHRRTLSECLAGRDNPRLALSHLWKGGFQKEGRISEGREDFRRKGGFQKEGRISEIV